jgi:2-amino-4-hydroxy-6-hydroxymethyldihydropteridine diphosphokinase
MKSVSRAFVGLGSNQGRIADNLERAVGLLGETPGVRVDAVSKVYYTEPQGVKDQPWFGNQVVRAFCGFGWSALPLLHRLQAIEALLGRERGQRWGPRVIDLDLLFFGREASRTDELMLPHPRIRERAFVLVPLLEIEPEFVFPDGQPGAEALDTLAYRLSDRRIYQD